MNNTEQFDEWIREEMGNLDDSPDHFRQSAIWQKLQTEQHPVPEKKSFFVTLTVCRAEASHYRIAVAVALLLLAGGIWWKLQSTPTQIAVNQKVNEPKNSSFLQEKHTLLAAKNDDLKEEVKLKKHETFKKQSKEELTEAKVAQAPIVVPAESENNVGKDWPAPADRSGVPNLADVSEAIKNIVETPELTGIVTVPEKTPNQSTTKTPKPKFKIVHANELADYQKAELAEVREKEAKAKGFVVINWNANSTNQSANSLLTYFKNKSSKAD
ncbi:hypothetical protein [Runella sp.]|jgi:hypothetical protein|uniref:hypothetical protein n=1 Tax=Runella sp. TaxID=1960881 RepID=UPI0026204BA9|nr:hypothetical protein [Runella sp.]